MKSKAQPTRTVDEYLQLPYTIEIQRDETDGYRAWFARVKELPGCMTQAEHFSELDAMIEDAMAAWISVALEDGFPIPEPRPPEEYSGKFVLRVPRTLHRRLSEAADAEGVSLNQFCSTALAYALGSGQSDVEPKTARIALRPRPSLYAAQSAGVSVRESSSSLDTEEGDAPS